MLSSFSEDTTFIVAEGVMAAGLRDEMILLDTNSGSYFSLDEVGVHIWELIQQSNPIREIHQALLQEFDVEPERCKRDLEALLQQMLDKGLIKA